MKKPSLVLFLLCLSTTVVAQTGNPAWLSTGQHYVGADLGFDNTAYFGGENFLWPMEQEIEDPVSGPAIIIGYGRFDNLGAGLGLVGGLKAGFALSNSVDLEAKVRYLSNHTSREENQTLKVVVNNAYSDEPVTNTYELTLSSLNFAFLGHLGLSQNWYAAAGVDLSSLLSNSLHVNVVKNGGENWRFTDQNTNSYTATDTSIEIGPAEESDVFSSSRLGVTLGAGAVFPLGTSSSLLDAELLVSIPLTKWLTSTGEQAINQFSGYTGFTSTAPSLWYASLTVGIRFPFSLGSSASGYASEETRNVSTNSGAGTETKAEIDAEGKVPLTGRVSDNKGNSIDANITVVDLTSNEVVGTDKTGSDGRYSVRVKAPGRYSVTADADGYLFGTAYFEVDKNGRILSSHPDIKLSETTNGRTRLLVFFDFNSSELKSSSYPELNRAVKLMKAVPTMQVEIAGYTDSVGSVEFNKNLSERRAAAVRDYLVKNGIAKKRVAAKGYGEDSPISDNGTEEGRAENRRVEFVVLSK